MLRGMLSDLRQATIEFGLVAACFAVIVVAVQAIS
jgi:Flp pilus assembly pilin Flp